MGFFSDAQGQPTPQSMVGSRQISNSFKLLCISSLPASMKESDQKLSRKCDNTVFPTVPFCCHGNQWSHLAEFRLIQAPIHVLITCKYEKDPIKNSGENVMTSFSPLKVYGIFFIRSRAANSAVLGPIWPNFELVRDVIDVLITCKYEEDLIKNEGARVGTTFAPL